LWQDKTQTVVSWWHIKGKITLRKQEWCINYRNYRWYNSLGISIQQKTRNIIFFHWNPIGGTTPIRIPILPWGLLLQ
jgi:hypothetical protein